LARLSALLGNERVGTPVLEETHRPDAFRMEPFSWHSEPEGHLSKNAADTAASTARVVLRRFRPSADTSVFVSDERYLESDKSRGQIVDQSGPFLFSGNWWDEKAWARAEYDMQLENGELIRAHEDASPARTWKVDGIYD
jgi:protein ImuB